jgi:hypothetical protein
MLLLLPPWSTCGTVYYGNQLLVNLPHCRSADEGGVVEKLGGGVLRLIGARRTRGQTRDVFWCLRFSKSARREGEEEDHKKERERLKMV